jgi:hypothetical protein
VNDLELGGNFDPIPIAVGDENKQVVAGSMATRAPRCIVNNIIKKFPYYENDFYKPLMCGKEWAPYLRAIPA